MFYIWSSSENWNETFNESMKSTLQNVVLKSLTSLFFCWFLCFTLSLTKNTRQHQAFRHFLFEWIIFFPFLMLSVRFSTFGFNSVRCRSFSFFFGFHFALVHHDNILLMLHILPEEYCSLCSVYCH